MSETPERQKSALSGLSWFQVAAGALAAMTSAWIASFLGVAGTIIGAALGSLVVTITSAVYTSTLDRGRTLVTAAGTGISTATSTHPRVLADADDSSSGAEEPGRPVESGPVWDRIRWKTVAITTGIVLVLSLVAIGLYEHFTDRAYGADSTNNHIGTPFSHSDTSTSDDSDDSPTSDPTDPATDDPDPESTATATPTPSASSSPTRATPRPSASSSAPATQDPDEE